MPTLFISDLHLDESHPELTALFMQFLQQQALQADAIYILGDFFEIWIGDDAISPYQHTILDKLNHLSQRIPIYFMPGNRDFLIGKKFCALSGVKLLRDPSIINLYGKKTLLMHGDSLCAQDKLYQFYRKVVRSSGFQKFFLTLPICLRKMIANKMRSNSKMRNQSLSTEMMDADHHTILQVMKKHEVMQMIYGHTHKPSICILRNLPNLKQYYVLSDWHQRGNIMVCDESGSCRLIYFN